jgi:hypothetical protein
MLDGTARIHNQQYNAILSFISTALPCPFREVSIVDALKMA